MDFNLPCECGKLHTVSAGSAGTGFSCTCGRQVRIPSLDRLRVAAGLSPYPIAPEDEIPLLISKGILPGHECVGCGFEGSEVVPLIAECERTHRIDTNESHWSMLFFPFGRVAMLLLREQAGPGEVKIHGRETNVPVPLAVCSNCEIAFRPSSLGGLLLTGSVLFLIASFPLFWLNWSWGAGCLALAIVLHVCGLIVRRSQYSHLKRTVRMVQAYRVLLDKFPNAAIRRSPRAAR